VLGDDPQEAQLLPAQQKLADEVGGDDDVGEDFAPAVDETRSYDARAGHLGAVGRTQSVSRRADGETEALGDVEADDGASRTGVRQAVQRDRALSLNILEVDGGARRRVAICDVGGIYPNGRHGAGGAAV
jgi:hypothetical protein